MAKRNLKILRFAARDVLRLSVVEIEPKGNVVTIGRRNGHGKSSCLNASQMGLAGARHTPPKPIREGADKAHVVLDLGDLIVERVITESSDRLVVRSPDGATYPRPQERLNKLFASIAFDPLAFALADKGEQVATLQRLTGVNFDPLEKRRKELFDQRTEVGREGKAAKARLDAHPPKHEGVPEAETSALEISERLEAARAHNRARAEAAARIERARDVLNDARAEVERLEEALKRAQQAARIAQDDLDDQVEALAALAPERDVAPLQEELRTVEETNRKVRENTARAKLETEVAAARERWDALTEQIKALDEQKRQIVADAKFPVPGLSFGEDGVTLNGIPFSQASRAEQLRVSVAVGIAMNPELRVLFVRDGSLLDEDGLRIIHEMAEQHDCQIWLEDARTTDPTAIIIEDGHVRGVEPEVAAE